jgi:hypothetical protein
MHQQLKCQIGMFLSCLESTERGDSKSGSRRANGGVEGTQTHCQNVQMCQNGHRAIRKAYGKQGVR